MRSSGRAVLRRWLMSALVLLALPARAQSPETAPVPVPSPERIERLRSLTAGRSLRFTAAGTRFALRRGEVGAGGIAFAPDDVTRRELAVGTYWRRRPALAAPEAPVPWSRVSRLEVHRSNAFGGAIAGTLLGILTGALVTRVVAADDATDTEFLAAGALGGGLGAGLVIGTAVGARAGHFVTVWSARPPGAGR